jgi:S25 ribosomal protein
MAAGCACSRAPANFADISACWVTMQGSYDKLIAEVPKYKMITPSVLADRLRVSAFGDFPIPMPRLALVLVCNARCVCVFLMVSNTIACRSTAAWRAPPSGTWQRRAPSAWCRSRATRRSGLVQQTPMLPELALMELA